MQEDIANVAFFLLWAERNNPNMRWGSITATEAVDSLARMLNTTGEDLRKLLEH